MEEVAIQKDVFDKLVRYLVSRPFCEVDALIKQIDAGCRPIAIEVVNGTNCNVNEVVDGTNCNVNDGGEI